MTETVWTNASLCDTCPESPKKCFGALTWYKTCTKNIGFRLGVPFVRTFPKITPRLFMFRYLWLTKTCVEHSAV
jgi:hypothetical protein